MKVVCNDYIWQLACAVECLTKNNTSIANISDEDLLQRFSQVILRDLPHREDEVIDLLQRWSVMI